MAFSIKSWITNNPYYKGDGKSFRTDALQSAAGLAGLGAGVSGISQGREINSQEPTEQKDAYGRPIYNLGGYAQEVSSFNPSGATGGQVFSSAAQGMQAGAPFAAATGGLSLLGGAAIGAIGGLIGGGIKRNREEDERDRAKDRLQSMQQNFNTSNISANQNILAQQAYEDQLNMYKLPKTFL